MTAKHLWDFLKGALAVLALAFVVGCAWGACWLGVAVMHQFTPR